MKRWILLLSVLIPLTADPTGAASADSSGRNATPQQAQLQMQKQPATSVTQTPAIPVRSEVIENAIQANAKVPWEEVESIREVIRTVDLSRAVHSGKLPEAQRGPAYFAKLQTMAGQEVLFISLSGSSKKTSLQEARIAIAKTNNPRAVSVKASAQTPLGHYVIPFSAGGAAGAEVIIVVNVAR